MRYQKLLSPLQVGNVILKNRLGYPNASPHFLQGPETYPAEPYRAFTANLAKNGAGFIVVAEWANYPQQRQGPMDMDGTHMQAFDMTDPAVHNYVSQMCEEVHFYGSKLILNTEINFPEGYSLHGGRVGGPGMMAGKSKGKKSEGPGPGPGMMPPPDMMSEMDMMFPMGDMPDMDMMPMMPMGAETAPVPLEMIPKVISDFVSKIRRYKNLGFDGINFRCDKILLPSEKERQDAYGGSVENRTRLLHEICAEIKRQLGKDFIIHGTLAWEQVNGYGGNFKAGTGYTEADTLEFMRLFEDVMDIAEIREHDGCASHPTGYNFIQGVHPTVDFCARAKAAGIKMLLQPLGGFQEPDEMERYLQEGKCDLFGAARAFMADPEYGKKLYEGRQEDITPCLKCNKCHGVKLPEPAPWTTVCSVNPLQGLGHKIHRMIEDSTTPKKVAVVGGGPAGMRCAIYAAERGHQVTLFEQSDKLGGQLFHTDYFPFKWPLKNFRDWLIYELGTHNVDVRLNTRPTPQMIKAGGYDALIAATGAVVNIPQNIAGIFDENGKLKDGIMTWADTCKEDAQLGKRVVIVGGSEVGIETAMYLAGKGHDVTVLTRQNSVAHNASGLHYITSALVIVGEDGIARESAAWKAYPNLHPVVKATTTRVDGTTVYYTDRNGVEQKVEADSVVLCGGMCPQTAQAMEYAGLTDVFHAIGDCNGAGNLEVCNREAFARAMLL